jgi:hypothetical protein
VACIDLSDFLHEAEGYCRKALAGTVVFVAMEAGASGPSGVSIQQWSVREERMEIGEDVTEVDESVVTESGFYVIDIEKPF